MSQRSASEPFYLAAYATRGERHRQALHRAKSDAVHRYATFLNHSETGPITVSIPSAQMETLLRKLADLDDFTQRVGKEFAKADAADLWNGDRSTVTEYPFGDVAVIGLPGQDNTEVRDYRPFDKVDGAPGNGTIVGPDGKTYRLTTDDRDPSWRIVSSAQGPIVQNQVSGGQKLAAGVAGISSPFGAAASPEFYRDSKFRIGPDGRPVMNGEPLGPKTSMDDKTAKPDNTTAAVVGAVDIGLTHASAVVDAAHEDDGYYAVRFQVNASGERRAIFGIYQLRTTDTTRLTTHFYTGGPIPITELDPAYREKKQQDADAKRKAATAKKK